MARTGIFGRSGAGKSWYFGWYLERAVPNFDYAIHYDVEDEEKGLSERGMSLFKTFYVDKEFLNREVTVQGREMWFTDAVILKNKKVRIVPDGLTKDENYELFARVCKLAMQIGDSGPDIHISADEAHMVVPARAGKDLDERIVRMLTGGRKKGVEYALCTQRPAKLHEDAYTQMNYGVYFQMTKDNDVAKVNNSTGFNAFTHLQTLGEREALVENLDTGTVRKINTNDMKRERRHVASTDGKADDVLNSAGEDLEIHAAE